MKFQHIQRSKERKKMPPNARMLTITDFIGRVQQGYDLWQYKLKHSSCEWQKYLQSEGITAPRARDFMRLAQALMPDRTSHSFTYLYEVARKRIPYEIMLDACDPSVSPQQRQQFFNSIAVPANNTEFLSIHEARERLHAILYPPKPVTKIPKITPHCPLASSAEHALEMAEQLELYAKELRIIAATLAELKDGVA